MTAAIIVAAGKGTRMGPNVDKLFLQVAGAPVIQHTWRRFDAAGFSEIILVVRDGFVSAFEEIAASFHPSTPWIAVTGGAERQDSVWNGLSAITSKAELVAIQDGARPCTPLPLIQSCLAAARRTGASVAAQRSVDTLKETQDGIHISRHLDRSKIWSVQTPQCFRREVILRALAAVRQSEKNITDDTAACELIGQSVELVESSAPNPKVTTPEDLEWVEYLLKRE